MRLLPGWLALLALLVVVEAGEHDVAQFLLQKAEKAYRAKDYEKAAIDFKRARQEFTPLPEAAWGLGQALEKLERESEAITTYRLCAEEVGAAKKPSSKWKSLARRANAAISRLRRRFAELDRLNDDFIDDCMRFGREHLESNPRWARTAFEMILKIDPTHKKARRYLDKFQKAKTPAKKKAEASKHFGIALIRGEDLEGWSPGIREPWTCAKGVVVADATGASGHINWIDDVEFSGRYDVRVRMRVTRDGGARRTFGLLVGNGKTYWHCFFIEDDNDMILAQFNEGESRHLRDVVLRDFDPSQWNTLRLEFDRGAVTVYVNKNKLIEYGAEKREAFDGKVALFAQNGRIEFKELEIRR